MRPSSWLVTCRSGTPLAFANTAADAPTIGLSPQSRLLRRKEYIDGPNRVKAFLAARGSEEDQ